MEYDKHSSCRDSNQILLNDKNLQVFIMSCACTRGGKSAVYDCRVGIANTAAGAILPPTAYNHVTSLTTLNGIQIQAAVLPQYTFRTDRQTDRPTETWDWRQL